MSKSIVKSGSRAVANPHIFDLEEAESRLFAQISKANQTAQRAVEEAMVAGAMLVEIREAMLSGRAQGNQHTPRELQFKAFLEKVAAHHGCTERTLYNWIGVAENGRKVLAEASVDVEAISLSEIATTDEADLSESAREARQLLFDWMAHKTINDALRGTVVDGDEASRVTRAHNGMTKGGTKGEDRKDYPTFIGKKLSDAGTHLENWEKFTASQKEATIIKLAQWIEGLDTVVIEHLQRLLKEELKTR